jgi:hypothetical protein
MLMRRDKLLMAFNVFWKELETIRSNSSKENNKTGIPESL